MEYGDVERFTGARLSPSRGAGPHGLPQPNYFGATPGIRQLPVAAIPQAFSVANTGYRASRARWPMFGSTGGLTQQQLSAASRFQATLRYEVPLTGLGPFQPILPEEPYYAPERQGTPVDQFFGLRPTRASSAVETPIPEDGVVGLLAQENERILRLKEAEALKTFKAAMTIETDDRAEMLSRAQRQLTDVRDLNPNSYLPSLLLLHTALEKGQMLLAITHLADVVEVHPSFFVERPDIASYFGDAELLDGQMRAYLRVGDMNPSPDTYALQAYCAWVLNDRPRVEQALEQMVSAFPGGEVSAGLELFQNAIGASMK